MTTIKLAFGDGRKQKFWSKLLELDVQTLFEAFSDHEVRNNKDGMCFVPAVMLVTPKDNGVTRLAAAVSEVTCLVYDIDGEQTLEEIKAIIEKHKFKCVAWTTHSHRTNTTEIKTDHYGAWAKKNNEDRTPSPASIKRYLKHAKKDHLKNVDFDVKRVKQTGEGTFWELKHDPIDKVRVLFPISKPIKFLDLHIESKAQQTIYKSIYHGVGEALGLVYDHACSDPSRLHYTPAHRDGAEFWSAVYDGNDYRLMDWTDMPRSAVLMEQASAEAHEDWSVTDRDGVTFNLMPWVKRNGYSFDIAAVFREVLSDGMIRKDLSGGRDGFAVECPFAHEHSDGGGGEGTYVQTDVDNGFVFRCSHNSCKNAGRSRLHYLKQYIIDGHITAADIGIDVSKAPTNDKMKTDPAKLLADLEIDRDTMPSQYVDDDEDDVEPVEDATVSTSFTGAEAERDLTEQINKARGPERAVNGLRAMKEANIVLTQDGLVDLLAASQIPYRDCGPVTSYAATLWPDILREEVLPDIHARRIEAKPVSGEMNRLMGEMRTGIDLDNELRLLGLFYGKPLGDMRRAYREQKAQNYQNNAVDATLVAKEKAFVKRYAKCLVESKLYILDMELTKDSGQQKLIGSEAMGLLHKSNTVTAKIVDAKSGKEVDRRMSLYDYCINHSADMKVFNGFTFDPSPRAGRRTKDDKFNTWFGFAVKGKSGDASFINEHIKDVWCGKADEHTYHWVMMYLAHIFQFPHEKPASAIVLGGPPGTGKSMPLEHGIGKMVAPYYGKSSRPDDICGKFTAFSCNKLVFLSEEAVWSGDKARLRSLKDRITSPTTNWEQKMLPAVEIPDFVRLFFTSNDAHVFDLEGDDRRYCILDTATTHQNDLKYFGRMRKWFDEGGREIWFNFLMNYKPELPWVALRDPPLTAARLRQVAMSRTPSAEFFVDLLKHGRLTTLPRDVDTDVTLAWPLDTEWVIRGEKFKIVFDQYVRHFTGSNFRYERNNFPTQFEKYIGQEYQGMIKQRIDPDRPADKRARCLVLPPRREVIRAMLAKPKPELTQEDMSWAEDNPGSHAET